MKKVVYKVPAAESACQNRGPWGSRSFDAKKERSSSFAQSLINSFAFRFLLSLANVATEIPVLASTSL